MIRQDFSTWRQDDCVRARRHSISKRYVYMLRNALLNAGMESLTPLGRKSLVSTKRSDGHLWVRSRSRALAWDLGLISPSSSIPGEDDDELIARNSLNTLSAVVLLFITLVPFRRLLVVSVVRFIMISVSMSSVFVLFHGSFGNTSFFFVCNVALQVFSRCCLSNGWMVTESLRGFELRERGTRNISLIVASWSRTRMSCSHPFSSKWRPCSIYLWKTTLFDFSFQTKSFFFSPVFLYLLSRLEAFLAWPSFLLMFICSWDYDFCFFYQHMLKGASRCGWWMTAVLGWAKTSSNFFFFTTWPKVSTLSHRRFKKQIGHIRTSGRLTYDNKGEG